jgi:hypothetical protein
MSQAINNSDRDAMRTDTKHAFREIPATQAARVSGGSDNGLYVKWQPNTKRETGK